MRASDIKMIRAISDLSNTNPFSTRRFELEKQILGRKFSPETSIAWNRRIEDPSGDERTNVIELTKLATEIVNHTIDADSPEIPDDLHDDYWNVATYILLYRHVTPLPCPALQGCDRKDDQRIRTAWTAFRKDYVQFFDISNRYPTDDQSASHLFACLCQIHRAFFHIFDHILGGSLPVTKLREKVWESIFSCNLIRYHRSLYNRMRNLPTLVTGPSGTGKELVARAVGLSQYIPFDHKTGKFVDAGDENFFPLNLSALSPTLIESELFGHKKGSFTGAVEERVGWLESCGPYGAVFLDEIGELDPVMQVKLLRVVQQRTYSRLGESKQRQFSGKIISATNRDLFEEIREGRFREDFYFRLCSDRIQTPTLREQLDDRPSELYWFALSVSRRLAGSEEAEKFADEVTQWIGDNLGSDYPWAGNIRELEQCVSSFMLRRDYVPAKNLQSRSVESTPMPEWLRPVVAGSITADELVRRYCTRVYSQLGSYEKTAGVLQLDRRTVKAKVDAELLEQLKNEG